LRVAPDAVRAALEHNGVVPWFARDMAKLQSMLATGYEDVVTNDVRTLTAPPADIGRVLPGSFPAQSNGVPEGGINGDLASKQTHRLRVAPPVAAFVAANTHCRSGEDRARRGFPRRVEDAATNAGDQITQHIDGTGRRAGTDHPARRPSCRDY
jgi:hypothetical protein